jgi:hypothetical protein
MIVKLILLAILIIIYANQKITIEDKFKMLTIVLLIVVLTMPNYNLFFEGFHITKDNNQKKLN